MERNEHVFRPPQEYFTIAGMTFNILGALQTRERLTLYSNRMRPGDREAQLLLRHLTNVAVSPEEYVTAMPRLFEYATKTEGGFDGDFIRVAEYFTVKQRNRWVVMI